VAIALEAHTPGHEPGMLANRMSPMAFKSRSKTRDFRFLGYTRRSSGWFLRLDATGGCNAPGANSSTLLEAVAIDTIFATVLDRDC
jgi:hypothetical protein